MADIRLAALVAAGGDPSGWTIPDWTLDKDMGFNEGEGIAFTFLSITAPGAGIVPVEKQAAFCRQANEYTAAICASQPTRYGFFACIPTLLDAAAAQAEITYALDTLKADGVTLYTRYGAGNHYLGHPDFAATWDLLDERGAVVFVHPTHPVDTALVNGSLPQPMLDYPHETTRAAADLITSGSVRAHRRVRIILSHAGGTLPYLALRPAAMLPYLPGRDKDKDVRSAERVTADFIEDARSFYFDSALSAGALTLDLLKEFARPGHVLFGSDFPYAPTPAISQMNKLLDAYGEKNEAFAAELNLEAATKLFPRLAAVL